MHYVTDGSIYPAMRAQAITTGAEVVGGWSEEVSAFIRSEIVK
jgi:hypothetical protein